MGTWGLGRIVQPVKDQLVIVEHALADRTLKHVHVDISWDEVAKYCVATPETIKATADITNKFPDRFWFGTDPVTLPDFEFGISDFEFEILELVNDKFYDLS